MPGFPSHFASGLITVAVLERNKMDIKPPHRWSRGVSDHRAAGERLGNGNRAKQRRSCHVLSSLFNTCPFRATAIDGGGDGQRTADRAVTPFPLLPHVPWRVSFLFWFSPPTTSLFSLTTKTPTQRRSSHPPSRRRRRTDSQTLEIELP